MKYTAISNCNEGQQTNLINEERTALKSERSPSGHLHPDDTESMPDTGMQPSIQAWPIIVSTGQRLHERPERTTYVSGVIIISHEFMVGLTFG